MLTDAGHTRTKKLLAWLEVLCAALHKCRPKKGSVSLNRRRRARRLRTYRKPLHWEAGRPSSET